jgi:predicted nucleic acid-binding protein
MNKYLLDTEIKNNLILVTNNEIHFERIKNIKIENWVKE